MKNSLRKRKASDMIGPHWSEEDLTHFYQAYRKYGKDWEKVAAAVKPRTAEMVEALYIMHMAYLSLPEGTASAVGLIALISDHYCYLLWPRCRTRFRNSSNGSRAWCRRNHTPSVLGWSYQRVDGRPAVIVSFFFRTVIVRASSRDYSHFFLCRPREGCCNEAPKC
ncbi:protein ALWAYS EARLY 1-like isoform X2 [Nicotiana tabacum]|uniref:Protein ALWAYS EARLY 3-like isoform X2 n=2 Tax=Nicotiana tabacum TaxID=4097 RepID=A0A1S3ZBP4_TOBAC|nr:protein ALWAYS EARLY 3-like isoform X2 [Nicotiana tomentosiformis]XP_009608703.1 protein ALWAYS EARLY 3-like isoform X2 [Nicotiana tomentosiformis]XP_009608704.1 protein ALWAYS EARLY 3-like isoform X2 [Nicotiana tomentosiformis]XP_009608705.1 protein ALWAYS EARLY 3-like isoform X2 [Nicotiana tomentosiformis]XP_009608707.1 protein ALWAYS EARLY 3-like isoform X2 [Nicotiana tomentosiformis]XP_016461650.1 PREDICTED: protein ALWAYS EARLY 3-like isoform X2 [Nicotiana tabacum]XP_016461651.1 PREDI